MLFPLEGFASLAGNYCFYRIVSVVGSVKTNHALVIPLFFMNGYICSRILITFPFSHSQTKPGDYADHREETASNLYVTSSASS